MINTLMTVSTSELSNQISTKMADESTMTDHMRMNNLSSFKNIIILSIHQNNMFK